LCPTTLLSTASPSCGGLWRTTRLRRVSNYEQSSHGCQAYGCHGRCRVLKDLG
jgi:hypothetical protein